MNDASAKPVKKRTTLQELLFQKTVPIPSLEKRTATGAPENNLEKKNIRMMETCDAQIREIKILVFEKGIQAVKSNRFCCAAGFFECLLEMDPDHIKAQLNLAVAVSRMGDDARACTILEELLARFPDNDIARENLDILKKRTLIGVR